MDEFINKVKAERVKAKKVREKKPKKERKPLSKGAQIALSVAVTLVFGMVYFYFALPALNFQSGDFYIFLILLSLVYVAASVLFSGISEVKKDGVKGLARFAKQRCRPVVILLIVIVITVVIGWLTSVPLFRAASYHRLLSPREGDFTVDISEVSFNEIPMLDEESAQKLGDRKMGELSDLVSQFEVSDAYTQINYRGRPVRVTYLKYGDFFKWMGNREKGIPAYIMVDMVTQEAKVVRLSQGMRFSPSEYFNRKLERHLRFHYPTWMFAEPTFEIDDDGKPFWVCPRLKKTIGLFGGTDIRGAVLVDAVTGECQYYEEVPTWVDRVYPAWLIMDQYNYHGRYVNGFWNSLFGQRDVTVTTEGYNYVALNNDVYMYTGVTSISGDQSNVGFLLSNQRTKETAYYKAPGAVERSAMNSAQGVVQDLGYTATWPLLLNINGEPTYFMSLKDASQLVKLYAMVNVAQYQVVATGDTVAKCEENYLKLLERHGIAAPVEDAGLAIQDAGVLAEIRTAVLEGNSVYFLRLEDQSVFYAISAAKEPAVVTFNVGDTVEIKYTPPSPNLDHALPDFLEAYSVRRTS